MAKKKNPWGKIPIPPPDEILFYRDVLCRKQSDLIANSKIKQIALLYNIELIFHPASKNISTSVKDGTIELTSFDEKGSENTYALNRHLRNSFCHLNILIKGDICYLRDCLRTGLTKNPQTTMTGKVNYSDLKNLINSMIK